MNGLIENAGTYRKQGVGIVKGTQIGHITPPSDNVPHLMDNFFEYLKDADEITLIKFVSFTTKWNSYIHS
jgi:Fic family protein